ncbi:ADP-ribose pyrophosphatase [hydrothermal vent metagenome]|uniref:ADP-ribose pyrophosphatase n=1 Tax=hydrothermal vent metagenome TaxID=652676 RepID=A0A3B1E250_9ZZZZ
MKIKNTELKIIKADLTELDVDAIVNPANNELLMGGGVAEVIRDKGGKKIEREALKKGPIEVGDSVATGAGQLKSNYVIHATTMGMDFKTDEVKIRNATASALQCAEELGVQSVAFPALGCGVGGFSLVGAAKIMTQEVLKCCKGSATIKEIIFCLYDQKAFETFEKTVSGYVRHIQEDLGPEPYVTTDIIIEMPQGIILIERSNPPYGWALPGGFLDPGESLEEAAKREAKEETNMDLVDLLQFHTYSDPNRDPRFHTISTVFVATGKGVPQFGDDAKGLKIVKYKDLLSLEYAFDHGSIIKDYLEKNSSEEKGEKYVRKNTRTRKASSV